MTNVKIERSERRKKKKILCNNNSFGALILGFRINRVICQRSIVLFVILYIIYRYKKVHDNNEQVVFVFMKNSPRFKSNH